MDPKDSKEQLDPKLEQFSLAFFLSLLHHLILLNPNSILFVIVVVLIGARFSTLTFLCRLWAPPALSLSSSSPIVKYYGHCFLGLKIQRRKIMLTDSNSWTTARILWIANSLPLFIIENMKKKNIGP